VGLIGVYVEMGWAAGVSDGIGEGQNGKVAGSRLELRDRLREKRTGDEKTNLRDKDKHNFVLASISCPKFKPLLSVRLMLWSLLVCLVKKRKKERKKSLFTITKQKPNQYYTN